MCVPKWLRKKNKGCNNSEKTITQPIKTASQTTTIETPGTELKNKVPLAVKRPTGTTSRDTTTKTNRPKVRDVHRKIRTIELAETQDTQTKTKQMEETMQMLGCSMINTAILQRIEKANKEGGEKSQYSTRQGDIQFNIKSLIKRPSTAKDDDTLYPLHHQKKTSDKTVSGDDDKEVELLEEDLEEEPNSLNYMYNNREIHYTCVDMIRNLDKNVILQATGEPEEGVGGEEKIQWDPYGPISLLISRPMFDCHTLRKNTFLSTALCCSTKEEQEAVKSKYKGPLTTRTVKIDETPRELTQLCPEYPGNKTCTVVSETLDKTPPTQETVEADLRTKFIKK